MFFLKDALYILDLVKELVGWVNISGLLHHCNLLLLREKWWILAGSGATGLGHLESHKNHNEDEQCDGQQDAKGGKEVDKEESFETVSMVARVCCRLYEE